MWNRWRKEYLCSLREHHRFNGATIHDKQYVGQVVLIHDDLAPCMKWQLGVITDVYKGPDGVIRSAQLKTKNGFTNRPISKLYPFEVQSSHVDERTTEVESARPKREAAMRALERLKFVDYY